MVENNYKIMIGNTFFKRSVLLTQFQFRTFASKFGKGEMRIPKQIEELMSRKLYKVPNHPLQIISSKIQDFFEQEKISDIEIPGEKFI